MSSQTHFSKGKSIPDSGVDALGYNVSQMTLDSSQDGDWEKVTKKNKNRAGGTVVKQWGTNNSAPRAWGQPDTAQRLGMRSNAGTGKGSVSGPNGQNSTAAGRGWRPHPAALHQTVSPPLEHGWNWAARSSHSSQLKTAVDDEPKDIPAIQYNSDKEQEEEDGDGDNDIDVYSDDDDDFLSDGSASDQSSESFETRKKHKMLRVFFEQMDKLTEEEITDPVRQWHCPACQNGPGAIDWYKGLQPLVNHARTKGSKRVKLHREFAVLLDEELKRRGASITASGEFHGLWEGLVKETRDWQIIWPPMVMVMNTRLEKDDNEKWLGMGNQELLDYFSSYAAVRAKHSYGPQGHRGISVLIFESSAVGFLEAESLDKHLLEQGTGREAWERMRKLFLHGGKRQLYGFLATKEDLDNFNQHSQGKSRLKFELRSYQEMVVSQLKQMSEDNQLLSFFKNKAAMEKRHSKVLTESLNYFTQKLRKTTEQKRIVLQRSKEQHEDTKQEMDFLEKFFDDQIKGIRDGIYAKEDNFEKIQQDERKKMEQSSISEKSKQREDELAKFIKSQDKKVEQFIAKRDELSKICQEKLAAAKKRYLEEVLELEKEFDSGMTQLMETYAPGSTSIDASSDDQ